jgi:TolB protein
VYGVGTLDWSCLVKHTLALIALPLFAAYSLGCQSTSPVVKSAPGSAQQSQRTASTPTTSATNDNQAKSTKAQTASLPTGNGFSQPSQSEPRMRHTESRRVGMIGLYGEGISNGETRDQSRPGRANIAQISFAVEGACFDPTVNRDGTHIAFASTMHRDASDIYIKAVNGTTVTQITSDPSDDVMPAFHPDGDRIAFASNRAGKWDIYMTSISGGSPVQLTNDADQEIHPTFSPDGRMLAYCKFSTQSGRWEIWAIDLENPGVRKFLEYGMFPQWSPDVANNKLLFQRARQRGSRLHGIWTIDYRDGEAVNPTEIVSAANAAVINPSWSPDGRRIVFVSVLDPDRAVDGRPEQSDLWVVNVDGSHRVKLTDSQFANFQPIWATDGRVYFVSNRSGSDNIWAIATHNTTETTRRDIGVVGVDPSRDR